MLKSGRKEGHTLTFNGNMKIRPQSWRWRGLGILVTMALVILLADASPIRLVVQCFVLALKLGAALLCVMAIASAVSGAGFIVRWIRSRGDPGNAPEKWRWISAEGLIVGLAAVVSWLSYSPTDVYLHGDDNRRIEIRQSSSLEESVESSCGSDIYVRVKVTYRDGNGRKFVQRSCEGRQSQATSRIMGRTLRWSTNGPRAVVILHEPGPGICLFFPEPLPIEVNYCPPAIEAYLRGDPIAAVVSSTEQKLEK